MKRLYGMAVALALLIASVTSLSALAASSGNNRMPPPARTCKVEVSGFWVSGNRAVLELRNNGHADATINGIALIWPEQSNGKLQNASFKGLFWKGSASSLETISPNVGGAALRTIQPGESAQVQFQFERRAQSGRYRVAVHFAEGCWATYSNGSRGLTTVVDTNETLDPMTPEPSETPDPSVTPDPSETPDPSMSPHPSMTPDPSETPDPSMTPDPSETPDPSMTPDPSETPDPSMTPDPSETPDPSMTPEPSETPDPSVTPEPSETPQASVKLEGVITGLTPSDTDPQHAGTMVVAFLERIGSVRVKVTADTRIHGKKHDGHQSIDSMDSLTFADLHVGDRVEVKGESLPDGSVLAYSIQVESDGMPGHRVEVRGVVAELIPSDSDPGHAGTMIVASGDVTSTVVVSTTTEIFGEKHDGNGKMALASSNMRLTFADLQVGDRVEVKGELQGDGSLFAHWVKVEGGEHHNGEVEFRGRIESLPGTPDYVGVWVVAGISVQIDANTRIVGTPVAGAWAEVKAARQNDGSLLATKIEVRNEHPVSEVEFKGPINSFGPEYWVVRGITISITTTTQIIGSPAVGLVAEVHAEVMPDRSLVATRIKVHEPEEHHDRFVEFKGRIQSFSDTEWLVRGVTVLIDAQTAIEGTPEVGKMAEVKGILQVDRTVLARKIEVKDSEGHGPKEVELRGTIVSMPATGFVGQWTVHALRGTLEMNVAFNADSQTIVDESHGVAQVGAFVEVHAVTQPDGSLLAKRIKVKR